MYQVKQPIWSDFAKIVNFIDKNRYSFAVICCSDV